MERKASRHMLLEILLLARVEEDAVKRIGTVDPVVMTDITSREVQAGVAKEIAVISIEMKIGG